jgi:uncharacterized metal-binding protein
VLLHVPLTIFLGVMARGSLSWCWWEFWVFFDVSSVMHSCPIFGCFQQALIFQSAFRVLVFLNSERIEEATI